MINIFVNIMHIIRILDKSFRIIKCFNPIFSLFLIKNWYLSSYGSLAYKYILSISGWLFIKFSNAFVFPDPEPPITNIPYGWSGIYSQLGLCFLLFSLVHSSKFIVYNLHYHATLLYLWQSLVTQLFYLYCHSNIFAVFILSKVLWHNYFICIITLIFLLYLFSPKSCDTIILFVLSLY